MQINEKWFYEMIDKNNQILDIYRELLVLLQNTNENKS